MEHIVFLTGRLAQASLARVLGGMAEAPFSWEVREIDYCQVVSSPAELEAALEARLKELTLSWNTSSS